MGNIEISKVCGLCAGCKRAIIVANEELKKGNKVTIFKEIVHNKNVNQMLVLAGAKFEDNLEALTNNETVIIRAHGEPPETYDYLNKNNINFKDCTCFNVEKIHTLVSDYSKNGYKIIILGKSKKSIHPEVLGTMGWTFGNYILIENEDDLDKLKIIKNTKLYLVCQTTFNLKKADELIEKIKAITKENNNQLVVNKSICNAQKQINISSAELAKNSDVMIVVGGKNSSNSIELFNNVSSICPSIFIEDINNWKTAIEQANIKLSTDTRIGITAGASTNKEELFELKQKIENHLIGE